MNFTKKEIYLGCFAENFSNFPKTANLNYTYWRLYLIVWPKKLVANIKDEYSNTSNKPQINSTSEELEAIVSRFALSLVFLEEKRGILQS